MTKAIKKDNLNYIFNNKLKYSINLLEKVLPKHYKPVVACSFGKNSIVVVHLLRSLTKDFIVLWNDTHVEYPDTYKFAKFIIKEWNLNVIKTIPNKTFWEIVDLYGFPIFQRNSKGKKQIAAYKCCEELKKKPTKKILTSIKCDLYLTGLSRHESSLREVSARKYGDYFFSVKWKHWKCHPILNWTNDDIWHYHKLFNLPYNSLYDKNEVKIKGGIRTACWPCPQAIKYGKLEHLRKYYPKLFYFLVIEKRLGEVILNIRIEKYKKIKSKHLEYIRNLTLKNINLQNIYEIHPCYFDKL